MLGIKARSSGIAVGKRKLLTHLSLQPVYNFYIGILLLVQIHMAKIFCCCSLYNICSVIYWRILQWGRGR